MIIADLIEQFDKEMRNIYVKAKTECNYTPTYFLNMIDEMGGLKTAKELLRKKDISSGFIKLYECKRLDLTVEALVLRNPWQQLFTKDERKIAEKRLKDFGYFSITWPESVLKAINRLTQRLGRKKFTRRELIQEELDKIKIETKTYGETPDQTLSRTLQDLRNEGMLCFLDNQGTYLFLDTPINIESEELPEPDLNCALKNNRIRFENIPTDSKEGISRYRKGQAQLRTLTLENYNHKCAFCDVADDNLLVASHISRWADDPDGRGDLSNIICLCKFHDVLFEEGYLSLSDDLKILKKSGNASRTVLINLEIVKELREPIDFKPSPKYIQKHRYRTRY